MDSVVLVGMGRSGVGSNRTRMGYLVLCNVVFISKRMPLLWP